MSKPVILTGLRANNDLHIGNYFGAIKPIVDLAKTKSNQYQINLFVPDLHSITTEIDYEKLQSQIDNNLLVFAAAGLPLNDDSVHIYRQSHVSAHSELTWILDCYTGFGELNRMTQFKDKSSQASHSTIGLFNYPVLMAADILLYNSKYVPVGDDQSQHLEFTRDIAQKFNNKFGDIFTIPESVKNQHKFFIKDQGLRVKDLADPTKKMSKSTESSKGTIFLSDSLVDAKKKIMSATTDSLNKVNYDSKNQPGISNLLEIYALVSGVDIKKAASDFSEATSYGEFKKAVSESVSKFLQNFQTSMNKVNINDIDSKLKISEAEMNVQANETLQKVQKAVGLR